MLALPRFLFPCLLAVAPLLSAEQSPWRHGYAVSDGAGESFLLSSLEDEAFPMMSVFKFPLAIVVLNEVEKGRLSLEQQFELGREQLDEDTWSPLLKKHPAGGNFSLKELLRWCIAESDNNACNFLLSLVGGPTNVQSFFRERYGKDFPLTIVCGEEAFKDRRMMYANHITPRAAIRLLQDVSSAAQGKSDLLDRRQAEWLLAVMASTRTGAERLKAGLSPDVRLAHKTGSSGTEKGHTIALNDIGVIMLPDGRHACIASFIRDSTGSMPDMEAAHARLAHEAEQALRRSPAERPDETSAAARKQAASD